MAGAATAAGDRELAVEAAFHRFVALLELGDPTMSLAFAEFTRMAEELRRPRYRYWALSRRAMLALLAGQLVEAERRLGEAAELAARAGEPDRWPVWASQLAILRGLRGDPWWFQRDGQPLLPEEYEPEARAFAHLARGETDAIAAILRSLPPAAERSIYRWRLLGLNSMDAELAVAGRALDVAERIYQELLPFPGELAVIGGGVIVIGVVDHYLGILAAAMGRWDDAVAHLEAAIETGQRLGAEPMVTTGRCELGWTLLDRGGPADGEQAAELLRLSASSADRIGMAGVAERAEAGLHLLEAPTERGRAAGEFRRDGEVWTLGFAGTTVRLRDAKGLRDIALLLAGLAARCAPGSCSASPRSWRPRSGGSSATTRRSARWSPPPSSRRSPRRGRASPDRWPACRSC